VGPERSVRLQPEKLYPLAAPIAGRIGATV